MKIAKTLQWNIETASREFGLNPRTMAARLTAASIGPDAEGFYSTQQIARAIFNDYESEKTRLTKAQADQSEFDLAVSRKQFVPIEPTFQAMSNLLFAIKREVEMSPLPAEQKDNIYREIQGIDLKGSIFTEVAFEEGEKV